MKPARITASFLKERISMAHKYKKKEWHNYPSDTDVMVRSNFEVDHIGVRVCVEEIPIKDAKPLTCKCCGAPINRETMTCEYCGTQYGKG